MGAIIKFFGLCALGKYSYTNYLTFNSLKSRPELKDIEFSPFFHYPSQIKSIMEKNNQQVFEHSALFPGILKGSSFAYKIQPTNWSYQLTSKFMQTKFTIELEN